MADETIEKKTTTPAEEIGDVLKQNGVLVTSETAEELESLAGVIKELVSSIGDDPEKRIEEIEETIELTDSQKAAIRDRVKTDVVGISAANKPVYTFFATSVNTVARAAKHMVD